MMAKLTKIKENRRKKKQEERLKSNMELHEGQRGKKQMYWRIIKNQPEQDILLGRQGI